MEVPVSRDRTKLAPLFDLAVTGVMSQLEVDFPNEVFLFECFRTNARQEFLYGFGREYQDASRKVPVTAAYDASWSWHGSGLAVDIIHKTLKWDAPEGFWIALARAAKAEGLIAGRDFKRPDSPHIQWGNGMPLSPTAEDRAAQRQKKWGQSWVKYGAV